jgi:hypothetical protein
MPVIQDLRDRISRGRSANITSVLRNRYFPTSQPEPDFVVNFRDNLQSEMDAEPFDFSCFVFPDDDIRTSQYVDSCGSAAITVALRHLHPQRIGQRGKRLQPIADFDFVYEKDTKTSELFPKIIGRELNQPYYRGRSGYVVWNQMTYYALTKNQIGSFMQLFNKENATDFRLFLHTESIDPLEYKESRMKKYYERDRFFVTLDSNNDGIEDRLCKILERNHLPVVLVDGLIWSGNNHYTFPIDEDEWIERASERHVRPDDCTVIDDHPLLAELKDLINDCEKEHQKENFIRPHDDELCYDLKHIYERLKDRFGKTTIGHAVVITGFYVRRAGGDVLWRVDDSNPSTKLNKLKTPHNPRDGQGSVNFMTTNELVSRMKGERRSPMILEMTSHSRFVTNDSLDQRSLIAPVCLDNW